MGQVLEEGRVGEGVRGWGPRGAEVVGPVEEGEGGRWVGDLREEGGDFCFFLDFVIEGLLPVGSFEDLGDFVGEFEEFGRGFW